MGWDTLASPEGAANSHSIVVTSMSMMPSQSSGTYGGEVRDISHDDNVVDGGALSLSRTRLSKSSTSLFKSIERLGRIVQDTIPWTELLRGKAQHQHKSETPHA